MKATLVEAANAASHTKGTYLKAKYHRVASRRGRKRAIVAVGHKILIAAYHILKNKTSYQELGEGHIDQQQKSSLKRYWTKRLENLGYKVSLEEEVTMEPAA